MARTSLCSYGFVTCQCILTWKRQLCVIYGLGPHLYLFSYVLILLDFYGHRLSPKNQILYTQVLGNVVILSNVFTLLDNITQATVVLKSYSSHFQQSYRLYIFRDSGRCYRLIVNYATCHPLFSFSIRGGGGGLTV